MSNGRSSHAPLALVWFALTVIGKAEPRQPKEPDMNSTQTNTNPAVVEAIAAAHAAGTAALIRQAAALRARIYYAGWWEAALEAAERAPILAKWDAQIRADRKSEAARLGLPAGRI